MGDDRKDDVVRRVVLALGSNLGDRVAFLQGGIDTLAGAAGLRVLAVSPVYETDPVGGPEQPDYLNAVLVAESALPPRALLSLAQAAEAGAGRACAPRWGSRTLDVDLITVGELVLSLAPGDGQDGLELPHPRAADRAFVLVPWLDVDAAASLPGAGPVADLVSRLDTSGVRLRADLDLVVAG